MRLFSDKTAPEIEEPVETLDTDIYNTFNQFVGYREDPCDKRREALDIVLRLNGAIATSAAQLVKDAEVIYDYLYHDDEDENE